MLNFSKTWTTIGLYSWFALTTLYVIVDQTYPLIINRINNDVFMNGANQGQAVGYQKAITDLGTIMEKQYTDGCKNEVPVAYGSGKTVSLYSVGCLKMAGVIKDESGSTDPVANRKK